METYAHTPDGWVWISVPDPDPAPLTDMKRLLADIATIKAKLGIV